MCSRPLALLSTALLSTGILWWTSSPASPPTAASVKPRQPYAMPRRVEAAFEPNRGQAPPDVVFVSAAPAAQLTRHGARFRRPVPFDLQMVGASADTRHHGEEARPGLSHYYRGGKAADWITDVPHFGRVRYEQVYPGIDATFYGDEQGLEYDFLIRPGADPSSIRLRFGPSSRLRVDDQGDLLIDTPKGTVRQRAPVAYQEAHGRRAVEVAYRPIGAGEVAFTLGAYDTTRPLVIDPVLVFGTYAEAFNGFSGEVAFDSAGNAYVTGGTDLVDWGATEAFVHKYAPNGQLLYRTLLESRFDDFGHAITVDAAGNAWFTGFSARPLFGYEFPRTADAFQAMPGGNQDAWFAKLGPTGNLLYSSLLGGWGDDTGHGIAIGPGGEIYVAGTTSSPDHPLESPLQAGLAGQEDVFISKFDPTGRTLLYSTYLGGSGKDELAELRLDVAGRIVVAGMTQSDDFPTANPIQTVRAGMIDGFVARLTPDGSMLDRSTYLGGAQDDRLQGLSVDGASAIYVTGLTASTDFPLRAAFKETTSDTQEGFVSKIDASGLVFSTYVGRNGGGDIAVTAAGAVFLAGSQPWMPSVIASKLNATLTGFEWTFGQHACDAIAVHTDGSLIVSGQAYDYYSFPTYNATVSRAPDCADCDAAIHVARIADAPQPPAQREQDDPAVTYEGVWTTVSDPQASGGTLVQSNDPGAMIHIDFTGTGIQLFGRRGPTGDLGVGVSNTSPQTWGWSFSAHSDPAQPRALLLSITGLQHTARRISFGRPSGDIWFDGFTVLTQGPMPTAMPPSPRPTWAPTVTPQPTEEVTRIEDTDSRITFAGNWYTNTSTVANHSGGSAKLAMDAGSSATLTFTGQRIKWIGLKDPWSGIARIYIDGVLSATWDTYSPQQQSRVVVYNTSFSSPGPHTIRVEATGTRNAASGGSWIWVDAFEVVTPIEPTPTPRPRPTATPGPRGTPAPTPTPTVGPTLTPTPAPRSTPGSVRIEDNDARVSYTGTWFAKSSTRHSGGTARLAMDAGASASLTFEGTGVRWIGLRDAWAGIARVFIDGVLRDTVDTYSAADQPQQVLFSADGLAAGTHTIRVEATGTRSAASGGSWIWVDAFDVVSEGGAPTATPTTGPTATPSPTATPGPTSPPPTPTPTPTPVARPTAGPGRIEQSDPRVVRTGTWFNNSNAGHSGGSAILAMDAGSTASLTFDGTGVRWIGLRDPWSGIARVFIDGTLRATVDTYSATQQRQAPLFAVADLSPGTHTLRIEATGTRNAASGGAWVWVDAFDITP